MTARKKWHMERSKVETYCGRRIDEDMPTADPSWFECRPAWWSARGEGAVCSTCYNARQKEIEASRAVVK